MHIWNQIPLFRVLWPFAGGIVLALFLPSVEGVLWVGAAALVVTFVLPLFFKRDAVVGGLVTVAFFAFGYAITCLNTDRLFQGHFSHGGTQAVNTYIGTVVSDPVERAKSIKAEVELSALAVDDSLRPISGRILCYFQKSDSAFALRHNDKLLLHGRMAELQKPRNPNEFNYKRYMHFHQITHQLYVSDGKWQMLEQGRGFIRRMQAAQHGVISIMRGFGLSDSELAIVSALVVGYTHYLNADLISAFSSAGALHVLSVSGLHVAIVYVMLAFVLKPLGRFRWGKYLQGALCLLALWGYALLTGMSPSVARSAAMFTFVVLAQQFNRHTDIFNTLATSAFVLLIINPFLLVEVGFQLSYLAVLGIVVLHPQIHQLYAPRWWVTRQIWGITSVSLAAQTATFPLGLLYFHQFPNYFLFGNLVVIPLSTVILYAGIIMVAVSWIPLLGQWVGFVLYRLVHFLDAFIRWVETLPGALLEGVDISIFETYFIYMVIVTSVVFLIRRSYGWLVAFLVALCAIEALNIAERWREKHQRVLAIYSVDGHEAVDLIDGTHHRFLATDNLADDFDKMRFHIHHHWWARGLGEPESSTWQAGWLEFEGTRIASLDSGTVLDILTAAKTDILHIRGRTAQHPAELLVMAAPNVVVLSQNLDWRTRSYWLKILQAKGQRYFDMREEGAFEYVP